MEEDRFARTKLLLGEGAVEGLKEKRVLIFGIGGVGGHATEALARSGIGHLTIVDHDRVDVTNCNRQIIATQSTVGREKVAVMRERLKDINPQINIDARKMFYLPETENEFDFLNYDYILDCVDTVTAKLSIVARALESGVPVISAMGCGNKLHPEWLQVADVYATSVCPLAKVMRRECRKRGLPGFPVVYSAEEPVTNARPPGSIAFVPAVAGLLMASRVVLDLLSA